MAENSQALAIADFERQGEDAVRLWLANTPFNPQAIQTNHRRAWAIEWLAAFDNQARLRNEALQIESLATAKSAKDAAWEAATAARAAAREATTANMIATLALIAAALAIAVSIIAIFIRK